MKMKFNFKNKTKLSDFAKCRAQRGLKTSQKRSFIIDYFLQKDRHFSVEDLYDEIKKLKSNISYSTVYRTLRLLAACGLASECNFGDGISRFEPVHDEGHHDHLICRKCGAIFEFENTDIEKLQKEVAKKYQFKVVFHKLELYGLCNKCQKKDGRNQNGKR